MKKFALAALLCGLSSPAMAQETGPFEGFYIGGVVGYDDVSLDAGGLEASEDGVSFGGVAGYDYAVGNAIFGAEIELAESSTGYTATNILVDGDRASIDAGIDLYIGARAGFMAGDRVLIYVKGGFTSASVNGNYDDGDGFSISEGDNMGGYRIGGGVEVAASRNLRVRVEYRYSDYGEFKYNDDGDVYPTGIDVSRSQIMSGLLFSF